MLYSTAEPGLATAALLATGIAFLSFRLRWLTFSGAVAQWVLGFVLLGIGGWRFTIPILFFFVSSNILTSFGHVRKLTHDPLSGKGGRRDAAQVAANGGVAGIAALMWGYSGAETWFWVHLGSLAAATADTWGTEIGILSRRNPLDLIRFKRAETGASGAISCVGSLGGLAGASLISLVGGLWNWPNYDILRAVVVVASGALGSLGDSIAGGLIQGQYRCSVCGRTTETKTHCGGKAEFRRGWGWVNNDVVNFVCTSVGGIIPLSLDFCGWNS